MLVRTLGIDLATRSGVTGVCEIDWTGPVRVGVVDVGAPTDDELVAHMRRVLDAGGWVAIDAPFGFPRVFTDAVLAWSTDGQVDAAAQPAPSWLDPGAPWDPINRRLSDGYVHMRLAAVRGAGDSSVTWPLSAVVERITPTVIRCAELLSRTTGIVDRVGFDTHVVEAYPAAALRLWGIPITGYKNPNNIAARRQLLDSLHEQAPWLEFGERDAELVATDDAIDASDLRVGRASRHPTPTGCQDQRLQA